MDLLQTLKNELNYYLCNEIDTIEYEANIERTFRTFDRNRSNFIELGEFIVGVQILCKMISVSKCALIFNTIIKADPRRISLDEFRTSMRIKIDPKKYIKIHNWFETIIQSKGIIHRGRFQSAQRLKSSTKLPVQF